MDLKISLILGLLLCLNSGVNGVSLFSFWSNILPGGSTKVEENSVISRVDSDSESNEFTPVEEAPSAPEIDLTSMVSAESKLTQLFNPMTWFKKTRKENTFQINAELGTVRIMYKV